MPRLYFSPEATLDVSIALERCRSVYPQNLPLLRDTLARVFDELEEAPLRWAIWRPPDYRRRLLPPFPFAVVYHLDGGGKIVVDALVDQRQDPRRRFPVGHSAAS